MTTCLIDSQPNAGVRKRTPYFIEKEECQMIEGCFVEKIGKVTYIVKMKSAEDAKLSLDDYVTKCVTKEAMKIKAEDAA